MKGSLNHNLRDFRLISQTVRGEFSFIQFVSPKQLEVPLY